MQQIFSPAIFSNPEVHCSKCNWKGKGSEIKQEDLFLTEAIELFCPLCNGYFGFVNSEEETVAGY